MQLRRIPMDGLQNFRDLGGYAAREGRMVAWNRLYRADGLAGLTEADAARLKAMNVRTVVDRAACRSSGPCRTSCLRASACAPAP